MSCIKRGIVKSFNNTVPIYSAHIFCHYEPWHLGLVKMCFQFVEQFYIRTQKQMFDVSKIS